MPQADLYYTTDQNPSVADCLAEVERVLAGIDARASTTYGRVHPVETFHHSHALLVISMLPKPDRDAAYASKVGQALLAALRPWFPDGSNLNINIRFDLEHYI